jgi:alpha-glucosidase
MVAGARLHAGGFNNVTEDEFVGRDTSPMIMGTRAQQLALYVVFQTPFQMVSDSPQAYAHQPEFQFIHDVPTQWDSMHVLNGEPGEFVTIARSHGKEWYLGISRTGRREAPCSFGFSRCWSLHCPGLPGWVTRGLILSTSINRLVVHRGD